MGGKIWGEGAVPPWPQPSTATDNNNNNNNNKMSGDMRSVPDP